VKRSGSFIERFVGEFSVGLMYESDYLIEVRRVWRRQHIAGGVSLAADDERVLAAKLRFNVSDGFAHNRGIPLVVEVGEWFVLKWRDHMSSFRMLTWVDLESYQPRPALVN
jgi:hypothetical protein